MNTVVACIIAAVVAFGISYGLGYIVIPFLHKLKFGQTILDIGPNWHKNKQGTPTMGGILFVIGTLVSFGAVALVDHLMGGNIITVNEFVSDSNKVKIWGGILMAVGFGIIGFLDDYIKVVKKRNLGLTIPQKTILQIVLMIGYLLTLYINDPTGSMFIPFFGMVETKIFFWVIGIVAIYCTTNAVNFTDGIDGLCGSVTATASVSFIAVAALRNCLGVSLMASALLGALIGYLIWNWYPAKVMMGDLGSMFLGGMIIAMAYAVDCPLIIIFAGIIYVIEFGSDILQIGYFKLTHGKRIFKMAPIHHHFEMCGWKEVKIVKVFSAVNLLGGIVAVLLVYFGNLS
ncbi:MAG: phospho-N-acetylmuramoyl-pentapeptide-transferase [Oscillospiraceae bacterium]|nr:phospho-N-acetylmuramoyl-pentapeptide-transferase [Oscillospiraceae bacterium]